MATGDITINGVVFTPDDLERITGEVSNRLKSTSKDPAQYEQVSSLEGVTSIPVFKQDGNTYKLVRVLTSILKGADGKEIYLQKTDTHLQWRWTGGTWNDLVLLADLEGEKGSSPEFRTTDKGLEWKYDTEADDKWRQFLAFDLFTKPMNDLAGQLHTHKIQIDTLSNRIDLQGVEIDTMGAGIDSLITEIDTFKEELNTVSVNKADGAIVEDGYLYLTSNGEIVSDGIELPAGGGNGSGGGGGGSTLRLINRGDASVGIPKGQPVVLKYSFSSVDYETQESTGNGTAVYYVNNGRVYTQSIPQGDIDFDITNYLSDGQNQIRIQVTDSYGAIRSLNLRVEIINLQVTSTFDDSMSYEGIIYFPFTPIGSGNKTIHFVLDGKELEPVMTTASNRQMNNKITGLSHGSHSLEVFATMETQGVTITSNRLYFSIIYIAAGATHVIISSSFHQTDATQYEVLAIPYSVYHPSASTANVQLKVNGEVVSNLLVDRKPQIWSYRIPGYGPLKLEIVSGNAMKTFDLLVAKSDIDSDAETENLELYLTSNGRSNNEENPSEWKYNNVSASLKGFNYKTNGWVLDENNITTLRISQGARVEIPFQPFFSDFKNTGKTIELEFKVSNVEDFTTTILSCFSGDRGFKATPNEIAFKSSLSSVSARFKENEMVRISFVIESRLKNRIIYIYVNGIASGAIQYVGEDTFEQIPPVGITLGSDHCITDIYNIRSYSMDLNAFQVLNNYIADTADVKKKLAIYDRNQVFDSSGEIQYNLLVNYLPIMTIVGPLPVFKASTPEEKKINDIYFENRQHPELSFVTYGAENDVQGTSSQLYPRKNFKWKIKNGITLTESGVTADKYALRGTDIPVNAFCMKADFVESSGTHNTGIAKYFDQVLRGLNYLTPPQREDARVRTTVDGYPCAIFHKETADSPMIFIGKYNFNNDKGTQETYGLNGTDECWEFLNNTSDNCLFKASDFTSTIFDPNKGKNVPVWTKDFEARYAENEDNPDPGNLKILTSWVVSCIGNPEKFKNECAAHFNVDNLLSYYLLTEFIGATDQRAKNMMMASWGNEGSGDYKYYFIFYDNDTVLGINNEGVNVFNYDIEYHDIVGGGYAWNGWGSELWKLVKDAFTIELANMYRAMRSSVLTYDKAIEVLNEGQADHWSEVVYNTDGYYKYIAPITESGNASYLYALQGSRQDHRVWWLSNRFMYMDSKYNAGDFREDFISFRTYTPTNGDQHPVKPNADFRLKLFKDSYVQVEYASRYKSKERGKANETIEIKAPDMQFNDTETAVYGISNIKSIGSLASFYPGTVDISAARSLTELVIGSEVAGYENKNLTHITTGNNRMLRRVDIQNCPNYTEALSLKDCDNIEEVYAKGSSISAVTLPMAGVLTRMELPATISNLTIRNQPYLTSENLVIDGIDNISTLVLENMNSIDQMTLIKRILLVEPRKLNRVRLIGVDMRDSNLDFLLQLSKTGGLDESNNQVPRAVITGKIHAQEAGEAELRNYKEWFPELEITVDTIIGDPVLTLRFFSSQAQPMVNPKFIANIPFIDKGNNAYDIKAGKGTNVNFTFEAANHEKKVGSYQIEITETRQFPVTYMPLRTLVFKRKTDNNPLSGATVKILEDSSTAVTDTEGKVRFRRFGAFGVEFTHSYGEGIFNVTASDVDLETSCVVYPTVTVSGQIRTDNYMPLAGAILTITDRNNPEWSREVVADDWGITQTKLSYGNYAIQMNYKGLVYPSSPTHLNVDISDLSFNFTLSMVSWGGRDIVAETKPEPNGNIQFTICNSNSFDSGVAYKSSKPIRINWGDGKTEVYPATPENETLSLALHTYPSDPSIGKYTYYSRWWNVEIMDCEEITYLDKANFGGTWGAFWTIGNSKMRDCVLSGHGSCCYVGADFFKNDGARTNFDYACSSFRPYRFQPGFFDTWINAKSLSYTFSHCTYYDQSQRIDLRHCVNIENISGMCNSTYFRRLPIMTTSKLLNMGNLCYNNYIPEIRRNDIQPNSSGVIIGTGSAFHNSPSQNIEIFEFFDGIRVYHSGFADGMKFKRDAYMQIFETVPPSIPNNGLPNYSHMSTNNVWLYVPDESLNDYKSASGWNSIGSRIKPASEKPV